MVLSTAGVLSGDCAPAVSTRKSQEASEPSAPALIISGSERLPSRRSDMGERWYRRAKSGEELILVSQRYIDLSDDTETMAFGPQKCVCVTNPWCPRRVVSG